MWNATVEGSEMDKPDVEHFIDSLQNQMDKFSDLDMSLDSAQARESEKGDRPVAVSEPEQEVVEQQQPEVVKPEAEAEVDAEAELQGEDEEANFGHLQ